MMEDYSQIGNQVQKKNVNLKNGSAIDNNKKYRKYLVENADSIIKYNQETS